MPSFVITEKCDSCQGQDKTACIYICPHDLMVLDKDKMKAVNQEPVQCCGNVTTVSRSVHSRRSRCAVTRNSHRSVHRSFRCVVPTASCGRSNSATATSNVSNSRSVFGNLNDPESSIRKLLASETTIQRKPELGTRPSVFYIT